MFSLSVFVMILISYITAEPVATVRQKLQEKLLVGYNHLHMPHDKVVHAQVGFTILHVHVDAATGTLQSQVWMRATWQDSRLIWDTDEYNVDVLHVQPSLLWKPDLLIYNSVTHFQFFPVEALVYPTGKVLWIPPTNLHTYCDLEWTDWPWDTQTCEIKIGSWTKSGNMINITKYEGSDGDKSLDISDYKASAWDLLPSSYEDRNVKQYPGYPDSYIDITTHLKLKRKDGMDGHLVVVPLLAASCLLFTALTTTNSLRLLMTCSCCVISVLQLVVIRMLLPSQGGSTPKVVEIIGGFLILALIQLPLEKLVKILAKGRSPPAFLVSQPALALLCLNRGVDSGEEMVSLGEGEERKGGENNFLSVIINRILFLVYIIIIFSFFLTILC